MIRILFFTLPMVLLFTNCISLNDGQNYGYNSGKWQQIQGNGQIKAEDRTVGNFKAVKVCCSIDAVINYGEACSVNVTADDNLLEYVVTEVSGDLLTIRTSSNSGLSPTQRIKVRITMPSVRALDASSSSRLALLTEFQGEDLKLDASSSATIEIMAPFKGADLYTECSSSGTINFKSAFTGNRLQADVSSSGTVSLEFLGKSVSAEGSSSGRINLRGQAEEVRADFSSSGTLDALDFQAQSVNAAVSSSGTVKIKVDRALTVDGSSGGSVYYRGEPSNLSTDLRSGANLRKVN